MANVDRPNGFTPVRHLNGAPYNGAANAYHKPVGYGVALFVGDVVQLTGTSGGTGVKVYGIDVEGMPDVNIAAATAADLIGVVVGFLPNPSNLDQKHSPASTAAIVLVADAPDLIFEAQEISAGTALAVTECNLNIDLATVHAGNATTGLSGMELDTGTEATTTANFRLLRKVNRPDNAIGEHCRWEVAWVEHYHQTATAV